MNYCTRYNGSKGLIKVREDMKRKPTLVYFPHNSGKEKKNHINEKIFLTRIFIWDSICDLTYLHFIYMMLILCGYSLIRLRKKYKMREVYPFGVIPFYARGLVLYTDHRLLFHIFMPIWTLSEVLNTYQWSSIFFP